MIFEIVCHSWNANKIGILQFPPLWLLSTGLKKRTDCVHILPIFLFASVKERKQEWKEEGRKGREGKGKGGPLFNRLGTIFKIEKISCLVEWQKWRKTLFVWKKKIFILRIIQQEIWEEGIGFWFLSTFTYTHQLDAIE